jgi:membrane protease subunit HflK
MHSVLTEGREQIAVDMALRLQSYLDIYQTGIQVEKVNVEETNPPDQVQEAFDDVNKAREDEERSKNEAEAYANGIIPEARGKAQRMIEEANAYQAQVVAQSEGEAQRFVKLLTEYQKAPEVTRERLYLDALQEVMSNSTKVMVDLEGGNNMMYLPLDKLARPAVSAAGLESLSPAALRELSNRMSDLQGRNTQTRSNLRREVR